MKGYVQVYTGNGKGKTTAALGLAVRAVGAGMKVFIGQFVKGMHYSELDVINSDLENVTVRQYGRDCFIINEPTPEDKEAAQNGFGRIRQIVHAGKHELVILDELNIAIYYGLISIDEVLRLIKDKPSHVELVITGRYAPDELLKAADLVTEMKEVRHYYQKGVQARKGIEF
ncbi:MAG: cob(I)yrinic acid a,c-diamide adenosyltransferase [Bacteroidales bacterium]|nr:cob(I)yrinic acid a,c-diamide adenosyltransferase [Bacteroidales bacterium]